MSNIRELSQLASVINVNDETKNVGIGTSNPESKLSIAGDLTASGNITAASFYGDGSNLEGVVSGVGISSNGTLVGTGITSLNFIGAGNTFAVNGNTVDISISGGGGGASVSIGTEAPANPSSGDLWYSSTYGRTFIYYEDDDSSQWVDAAPFNLGIINELDANSLTVNGNASISGNLNVTGIVTALDFDSASDINLKTNIKSVENSLEKVIKLNGVTFTWKQSQQDSIGVIAQEVEEIFPELVKENEHHKSVNYNGLIGVLIEAIKEQQKQIDELKKTLNK
jgi:hypothetical protein